jgi:transposase
VAQDWRDELIAELRRENAELKRQLAAALSRIGDLERQVGRSSRNSSQPPSADTPAQRDEREKKPPTGRKPGGQPGHKAKMRALLPAEKVTRTAEHFPPRCLGCGDKLPRREDESPLIHQVIELPEIVPDVTEHRLHRVCCGRCGRVSCGTLPAGVPAWMLGPRLMAFVALLTGFFHLSRRQARSLVGDLLGVSISLGALSQFEGRVSAALEKPVQQAHRYAVAQRVKHADGTTWRRAGKYRALWVLATELSTVFKITADGALATVKSFLRRANGFLVSDRGGQFLFWAMARRQICWAHLLRKFVDFSEHSHVEAAELGRSLVFLAHVLFHEWHRIRDGTLSRADFQREMQTLGPRVEELLERGAALGVRSVSGSCKDILQHRAALWTFVRQPGVEPTNNHSERELRGFVQWRRMCFGSQSDRGERFAERMMTVVHTLRKQRRHVLSFLTDACTAMLHGDPPPQLVS